MSAQLDRIVDGFQEAQRRLHRLSTSLSEEQFGARRDPDRWSVAENVAHLNLTSLEYLPVLRDALAKARALGGSSSTNRMDAVGWLLSRMVGPMPKIAGRPIGRFKTPAGFVPSGQLGRIAIMAEFDRLQSEQVALVREGEGLPLDRVKIASPFDTRASYNLFSAFVILPRHQLRHAEQAEAVWSSHA